MDYLCIKSEVKVVEWEDGYIDSCVFYLIVCVSYNFVLIVYKVVKLNDILIW